MPEFTPFHTASCAASVLTEIADGKPESRTVKNHTDTEPRVNTLVLCGDLLEDLTESTHEAMEADDEEVYDAAMATRDEVILIYGDALRSNEYAADVWFYIATRRADEVTA